MCMCYVCVCEEREQGERESRERENTLPPIEEIKEHVGDARLSPFLSLSSLSPFRSLGRPPRVISICGCVWSVCVCVSVCVCGGKGRERR